MDSEGVPKVDTINLIYFVPGVTAAAGTLLGIGICHGWFDTPPPTWMGSRDQA